MREVSESDWKKFKALRVVALERFCEHALDAVSVCIAGANKSAHQRYLDVFRLIEDRDKKLGRAFDDMRRSTMIGQLAQMRALGLIRDDELEQFSDQTQDTIELLTHRGRRA
jgi:hypothetical protein